MANTKHDVFRMADEAGDTVAEGRPIRHGAVVSSTAPAFRPYRYASPESPTKCSAPMFVAYSDAPMMGHVRRRPARKNPALLSPDRIRNAQYTPNTMLPLRAPRQTAQSSAVSERLSPIQSSSRMRPNIGQPKAVYHPCIDSFHGG